MKVSKLIRELKKMPQNLDVKYAHCDNAEYEAAGESTFLMLFDKSDFPEEDRTHSHDDINMFNEMPQRCVIIRG